MPGQWPALGSRPASTHPRHVTVCFCGGRSKRKGWAGRPQPSPGHHGRPAQPNPHLRPSAASVVMLCARRNLQEIVRPSAIPRNTRSSRTNANIRAWRRRTTSIAMRGCRSSAACGALGAADAPRTPTRHSRGSSSQRRRVTPSPTAAPRWRPHQRARPRRVRRRSVCTPSACRTSICFRISPVQTSSARSTDRCAGWAWSGSTSCSSTGGTTRSATWLRPRSIARRYLRALIDAGVPVVAHQLQCSLLDRCALGAMREFCVARSIRMFAYGALAGGFLHEAGWVRRSPLTRGRIARW